MLSQIKKNIQRIKEQLEPFKPKIIAVTKYVDVKAIIEAYDCGILDIGENKVKDGLEKIEKIPIEIRKKLTFHLIGHLQKNKVRKAVGTFDYIQSVDSLRLAQLINKVAKEKNIVQKILLQVNNANEESKTGFKIIDLKDCFQQIINLESVRVQGLMNIAPLNVSKETLKELFCEIKNLKDYFEIKYKIDLPHLSMGMSNDFKEATQCGATMVRIGSALFK